MLQVFYDDYELTRHFTVRRVVPTLSAPVTNNYTTLNHLDGSNFKFSSLGQIELKIEITIKEDIRYHLDELNKVLYTDEPKKLIISDMDDRYLMCKLDGKVEFTSRFFASDATLTFVSPHHYWTSTSEKKIYTMDSNGKIEVENNGSAPALPEFDINFTSDCGYIAIVGNNGYITLGNANEQDKIAVKPTESALNEEMHNVDGWTRVTNVEQWVTDYKKISSKGSAQFDEYGSQVNKASYTGLTDSWQGHAYVKPFNMGTIERKADNFRLRSRVVMQDRSGKRNTTSALLIVVLDDDNRPIMTTSIYDTGGDVNKLVTSFKVNSFKDGDPKHSTIIHNGSLSALNGFVEMKKSGNKFDWIIHTDSVNTTPVPLKVGDKVKLKTTATKAASGHNYKADYKNREYTLSKITTWPGHSKKIHALSINGQVIYHVYADDIQQNTVTKTEQKQITKTLNRSNLAQLNPSKVLIWQGSWGNSEPYNKFSLNSVVVDRIYTTNSLDIENVFRPGDHLYINNATGDILKNGTTFEGFADYDNRFFKVDYAKTELQVVVSNWATLPSVKVSFEERFL